MKLILVKIKTFVSKKQTKACETNTFVLFLWKTQRMRYGVGFQIEVYESLKLLTGNDNKESTVNEILDQYLQRTELNPSKRERKNLYARVWRFLEQLQLDNICTIEQRRHDTRHVFIGYYKYNTDNG